MRFKILLIAFMALAASTGSSTCQEAAPQKESTLNYIRRNAGLPPRTTRGQIEIVDVGHDPLSTMIAIAADRMADGWSVSYACASSPYCAPDHRPVAREYALNPQESAEVDALVLRLKSGEEPGGLSPSPAYIGGVLRAALNLEDFKQTYTRVGKWGPILGRLEKLLSRQP
jgi:hypothetical protein